MYVLVEEESRKDVLSATDLLGFFVEPSLGTSDVVTVIGTSFRPERIPLLLEDMELQVRNRQNEEIGSYYIGQIEVTNVRESEAVPGAVDLAFDLRGYASPFPYARELWRTWIDQGPPTETGLWKRLPPEAHESWVHVAQQTWFRSGHEPRVYGHADTYEIDGADLANIESFYCALGEATNGPAGYLGSSPAGLADCLNNTLATPPFRLRWRNFETTRATIDADELGYVLSALRKYGVEIETPD
ncbi:hypothetical protein [Streptomyces sp. NPDC048172]|uniref:barstar family protein n=1 Tax=Streptomyces sp. NPDC048172 TaxID=3365505 RepID=UPI003724A514